MFKVNNCAKIFKSNLDLYKIFQQNNDNYII